MKPVTTPTDSENFSGRAIPRPTDGDPDFETRLDRAPLREDVPRRRDALFRRSLAAADVSAVSIAVLGMVAIDQADRLLAVAVIVPFVFVVMVKAMGLYDRDEHLLHKSTLDEVPAIFSIASFAALLLWLTGGFFVDGELGRDQILVAWITLLLLCVCLRALARATATRLAPIERCLLVGNQVEAENLREKFALTQSVKAELVGVVSAVEHGPDSDLQPPFDLDATIVEHAVERVILGSGTIPREDLVYTIRALKTSGVKVSVLPEASRVAGSSVELDHLHGTTLLGMRRFEFTRSSRLIKRSFDFAGSLVGLVFLAPVLLIVALAIRLDSPGSVLFRQTRVGRHGHEFRMLKFRSMVTEADQMKDELAYLNTAATGLFKIPSDPRVTRVGKVIRRLQLDEVPQLLNVVKGEMSLVGPRPLVPSEDRQIEGWYRRRLDVPPGMTGHWQILGSSARIPIDEMVKLDYLYVANWSLWGDIRLLLRTVPFVLGRRGV